MVFDYYGKRIMTFLANCIGFKKALFENVLHCTEQYLVDKKSVDMVLKRSRYFLSRKSTHVSNIGRDLSYHSEQIK